MGKLILDAAARAKLNGFDEQIEVCDEQGNTLGYLVPPELHERLVCAWTKTAVTNQELEDARREIGGMTTGELLAHLESVRQCGKVSS